MQGADEPFPWSLLKGNTLLTLKGKLVSRNWDSNHLFWIVLKVNTTLVRIESLYLERYWWALISKSSKGEHSWLWMRSLCIPKALSSSSLKDTTMAMHGKGTTQYFGVQFRPKVRCRKSDLVVGILGGVTPIKRHLNQENKWAFFFCFTFLPSTLLLAGVFLRSFFFYFHYFF